ncbi:VOC family protein [Colwellia sp. 12G3]|uniref:VOC family protein n=1 Tax=Colwellia sp. 12G3 TaxID=2058299 RepID=UPI000C344F5F|nr:VOC family protein [Colwellia sp. 12G3]PKI16837.1 glyoxalase [Colwellia sp. 12G3]
MYGNKLGEMAWMDLSVPDAKAISDFYQVVLGWRCEPVEMTLDNDTYSDFVMTSPTALVLDETDKEKPASAIQSLVTGICHAKGENQDMPAVWLPYFLVKNLDESILKVKDNGGTLATKIKNIGADRYVVIKDPAGAMAAIYQKVEK